jgi:hypothetical protein
MNIAMGILHPRRINMMKPSFADLEKTGILGSWILRNISQNQLIEEHFDQLSAYH